MATKTSPVEEADLRETAQIQTKEQPDAEFKGPKSNFSIVKLVVKGSISSIDAEKLWAQYTNKADDFFAHLHIDSDGGLDHVEATLFTGERWVWSSLSISFLVLNIYYVFILNLFTVMQFDEEYAEEVDAMTNRALLTNTIFYYVSGRELHPKVLLAILELCMFVFFLGIQTVVALYHIFTSKSHAVRWHGVATLYWQILPEVSSMSAMKLLSFVVPSLLIGALTKEVKKVVRSKDKGFMHYLLIVRFLGLRLFAGVIGYDAFVVKFWFASLSAVKPGETHWYSKMAALAFMNQILGIVQVSRHTQRRLFVYIFGGADAIMSAQEEAKLSTWQAMLAQRIWQGSRKKSFKFTWFSNVMLSYNDSDFQTLTLQSDLACPKEAFAKNDGRSATVSIP